MDRTVKLTDQTAASKPYPRTRFFTHWYRPCAVWAKTTRAILESNRCARAERPPAPPCHHRQRLHRLGICLYVPRFGSENTILDGGDRFLPHEDRDIAGRNAARIKQSKGIKGVARRKIERSAIIRRIHRHPSQGEFHHRPVGGRGGARRTRRIWAWQTRGIETDPRGFILVDDHLRVQRPKTTSGRWATCGQSDAHPHLARRLPHRARTAFRRRQRNCADRTPFPTATFTEPPLAHIGLTETAAQQSGREVKVLKLKADAIPKAKILNQTDGPLKAVVDAHKRRNPRRNPVLRRSARNHQPV